MRSLISTDILLAYKTVIIGLQYIIRGINSITDKTVEYPILLKIRERNELLLCLASYIGLH